MKLLAPVLLAVALLTPSASAQPKSEQVKADLMADVSAVKPGEAFTVGVLLTIEPGWHVYWLNPGDSGVPTTVKLKAPDSFEAGPVRYPVPVKFNQPGDVLGYGYEQAVLLTAQVTPPADLKGKAEFQLTAEVNWLCCKDACIPGRAKLTLKLPVSEQAAQANRAVFEEWAPRLPVEDDPAVERAQWEVDGPGGTITHTMKWKTAPREVELYPGPSDAVEFQKIDVKTAGRETRTTIRARLIPGPPPDSDTLPSLLVYTDEAGVRHGIAVEVPVNALEASAAKQD